MHRISSKCALGGISFSSSGPPLDGPLASVEVSGRAAASFGAESATIREAPARVVLRF